ncbi:MAG: polysaccharide deacetylase family protein [Myxococcota bacterium]
MRWPAAISFALAVWLLTDLLVGRSLAWPEWAAIGIWLAALVWASYDLRSQAYVRAHCHGRRDGDLVALTFDDGPDPATTPGVLDTLERHGAHATFFVLGEKVAAHPEIVRRIVGAGHEVGNHGRRHRWRDMISVRGAQRLIAGGREAIEEAIGSSPPYLRPPYGVTTPALGVAVRRTGVAVAGWSLRTHDIGENDAEACAERVLARVRAGDIVLMHDAPQRPGGRIPAGPAMLDPILTELAKRGLKSVTVSTLLADDA